MTRRSLVLALDTASPVVSLALASPERVLASRSVAQARSSKQLLPMLAEVLDEAGSELEAVEALVALRGPGSFTGLRVGLATVQGLHQALEVSATAVPTLDALATAAADGPKAASSGDDRALVTAVDVLRGEWVVQRFAPGLPPRALDEPRRLPVKEIASLAPCRLVGFGVEALGELDGVEPLEPSALAPAVALSTARHPPEWRDELLTEPLYFRPPAVSLPKRKPGQPRR